ncbi:MAG TPA: hypothetical protein VGX68_03875 [Thermoanaerobaculia bacterium]|nr:hypothetical protein [Thermoanaerobaculia bacterium]
MRELPETEFQVAATALRSSREQQTAVLEHGTEEIRQTLSLDLAGQKNAFERRTQVAQGFTDNFVRAIGQATDSIRSLDDIQRAVPKVAAIQGAIAGVATGALPGSIPVGAIPGTPAAGLLADTTTATPLATLLSEFTNSIESLACDPAARKELLSFGLHVVAEALRGRDAKTDILETYVGAITGKLSSLLPILSQEQIKLLKRLQDIETLRKKLG